MVKETSRTFKGGASNLPAAFSEPASEALLGVCFRDAAKQGPRANAKRMHEYRNGVRRKAMVDLVLPPPTRRLTSVSGSAGTPPDGFSTRLAVRSPMQTGRQSPVSNLVTAAPLGTGTGLPSHDH